MKRDIYQEITDWAIAAIEAGTPPWTKQWNAARAGGSLLPINATTGAEYRGVNIPILWSFAGKIDVDGDLRFLTFKQAQAADGHVRKGEHGVRIVKVGRFVPKSELVKPLAEQRMASFLKTYTVFHVSQCEALDPAKLYGQPTAPATEGERHAACEAIIAGTGADIRHGGDRAFYRPSADMVQLPDFVSFPDPLDYYRTAFHELAHWTGHESRLARLYHKTKGDEAYAREELVAEMAAAFVAASQGIEPALHHASYLASWLRVLRADTRALVTAAAAASKAADMVRGIQRQADAADAPEPTAEPAPLAA